LHLLNQTSNHQNWWEGFNDPILNDLIELARCQNLDLFIARTRLQEARQIAKGAGAKRLPQIDGSFGGYHAHFNQKTVDELLGTNQRGRHSKTRNVDLFEIGFDASFEIDLFGKSKRDCQAMIARLKGEREAMDVLFVTLTAEIARLYVELRGYQQREGIINEQIQNQMEICANIDDLIQADIASELDQMEREEQLDDLRAKLPDIEFAIHQTIYRLSILVGSSPTDLFAMLEEKVALPQAQGAIAVGIPSLLLRNRSDIKQAEYRVEAATYQKASAIAGMFPRLTLKGFFGDVNTHLPSLFSSSNFTYLAGPQLLLPIFNSKLLEQDVVLSKIVVKRALLEYQKCVLQAIEEVENGIAAVRTKQNKHDILAKRVQKSLERFELNLDLFENGFKSSTELLGKKFRYLAAKQRLVQGQVELIIQQISLYKALGGSSYFF
jgi:NodT family efflux transporter outer membrane factor (OMF) lipoprotein